MFWCILEFGRCNFCCLPLCVRCGGVWVATALGYWMERRAIVGEAIGGVLWWERDGGVLSGSLV